MSVSARRQFRHDVFGPSFCALGLVAALVACGVDNVKFSAPVVAIISSAETLAIREGEQETFTVALSARPKPGPFYVTLVSSDEAKVRITPSELVFDQGTYDLPQTITVTGVVDRNFDNEQATITAAADSIDPVSLAVTVVECPTLAAQDFWILFTPNVTAGRREVYAAGEPGTMVSVAGEDAVPIPASGVLVTDTGMGRVPGYNIIESGKAIQVTASAPVQVFANNYGEFTVDAFTAVPLQLLGTEYRSIGYRTSSQSQVAVYATADNTTVTIGTADPIILNRGQSYVRYAAGDATGLRVVADKPVAVNSGDACINTGLGACDHVEEMLFPIASWPSDFFVPLLPQSQDYRVVAATNGTEVRVDGALVATLAAGEFYSATGGGKRIQTSQPAQAYIIALGETDCNGDPAFVLLPGTQNAAEDTTFSALSADNVNTLVVSMPSDATASLRLDGRAPTPAPTWVPYASGGYSYAQIPVTAGPHKLTADKPFIPIVWGERQCESYGYVAAYGYPRARCELP